MDVSESSLDTPRIYWASSVDSKNVFDFHAIRTRFFGDFNSCRITTNNFGEIAMRIYCDSNLCRFAANWFLQSGKCIASRPEAAGPGCKCNWKWCRCKFKKKTKKLVAIWIQSTEGAQLPFSLNYQCPHQRRKLWSESRLQRSGFHRLRNWLWNSINSVHQVFRWPTKSNLFTIIEARFIFDGISLHPKLRGGHPAQPLTTHTFN